MIDAIIAFCFLVLFVIMCMIPMADNEEEHEQ